MEYQILLYYKYTHLSDPEQLMHDQRQLCQKLGLTGRIIVAEEGINGTVEGTVAATEEYAAAMLADPRFAMMNIKRSTGTGSAFPKLSVKLRREIVSAHFEEGDFNPADFTAPHLSAEELHHWFETGKEFYIIDMRNSYEHLVGHFEGSVLPQLRNFRDLAGQLPALQHLKNKTIVTVCTGGVRCEKASGYLLKHGFKEVYQLENGIVTYMEKYPNEHFLGKLYVFDGRVTMGFNTKDQIHQVVGRCEKCGKPSEHYVNDDGGVYRKHFICCEECAAKEAAFTSVMA